MPSIPHEAPIEIIRAHPELSAELVRRVTGKLQALTATIGYRADFVDRIEARAEARALMIILESRSLHLSDVQHQQVMTCTDVDTLERWLRRAGAATTAGEVFKD